MEFEAAGTYIQIYDGDDDAPSSPHAPLSTLRPLVWNLAKREKYELVLQGPDAASSNHQGQVR